MVETRAQNAIPHLELVGDVSVVLVGSVGSRGHLPSHWWHLRSWCWQLQVWSTSLAALAAAAVVIVVFLVSGSCCSCGCCRLPHQ